MISKARQRVSKNTATVVNDCIRGRVYEDIAAHAAAGPEAIDRRLAELDHQWDVERAIEVEAPLTILAGVALSAIAGRKWVAIPLFASSMLLLHGLHGWYPLLPFLRRKGLRTQEENATVRYALKVMRGDFDHVGRNGDPAEAVAAARKGA